MLINNFLLNIILNKEMMKQKLWLPVAFGWDSDCVGADLS